MIEAIVGQFVCFVLGINRIGTEVCYQVLVGLLEDHHNNINVGSPGTTNMFTQISVLLWPWLVIITQCARI